MSTAWASTALMSMPDEQAEEHARQSRELAFGRQDVEEQEEHDQPRPLMTTAHQLVRVLGGRRDLWRRR